MTISFRVYFDGLKALVKKMGKIRHSEILAHCGYLSKILYMVCIAVISLVVVDTIFAISVVSIHDTYLGRGQTCPSQPIFRIKYNNMFYLLFQVCKL